MEFLWGIQYGPSCSNAELWDPKSTVRDAHGKNGLITGELSAVIMLGNVASSVKRIDTGGYTEKGKTRPTSGGDNIMSLGRVVFQMI